MSDRLMFFPAVPVSALRQGKLLRAMGALFLFQAIPALWGATYMDPTRVLVVYKSNSVDNDHNGVGDSLQLALYYAAKRNVPLSHLLAVNISIASPYYGIGQYSSFYSDIVVPIQTALASLGPTNIDVILLAGELPLAFFDGGGNAVSVDSALMGLNLLTSDPYSPVRLYNPYSASPPLFTPDMPHFSHSLYQYNGSTMYLVNRLGSDSSLLGINRLDQSLYAEWYLYPHSGYFYGIGYVDSQYGNNGAPYTDAFLAAQAAVQNGLYNSDYYADLNVAYAEHYVTHFGFPLKWENTTTAITIGSPGAMFSDGTSALTAPRALFYGGWWNYQNYNDVWEWLPGSFACDLNSAATFGTQALAHGASAASYVVTESFVYGHQRPSIIYYYLLNGYSFAEASALGTIFIGGVTINEGDPLYAPLATKTPQLDTQSPRVIAGYPKFARDPATGNLVMSLVLDNSAAPEVATARIDYGSDTSYGSYVMSTGGFARVLSVSLPWSANQFYHYRITLTDPVGNVTTTADSTYGISIVAPAYASTNPVTGTTTALSVLGGAPDGESAITYTWSASGPAPVTFSPNGSNAAKNTTASFSVAGSYTIQASLQDVWGAINNSTVAVTVSQSATMIAVRPYSLPIYINVTQQFAAIANDQFGNAVAPSAFAWSVNGGGTISSSGLFTAGAAAGGPFTVSATVGSTTGTASVLVTAAVPPSTQGQMGYWSFDEGAGSIAHDDWSGYDGTITGASWTTGISNSALSLNGGSNYVVTPGVPLAQSFSLSAWVSPGTIPEGFNARIAETQYTSGFYLGTNAAGTKYKLIVNNGTGATGSCGAAFGCAEGGTITSGWHLVTGTFDGTTAKLYVDNGMVASETFAAPANANLPLYIGRYYGSTGYGWNGVIDEVRLYNRALSSADVSTIYGYYTGAGPDTTPPTTPTAVNATAVSSTQINMSWTASTDNVGVAGYRVYRNGTQVGTTTAVTYSDTGLTASTTYSYTVAAFDAAGNVSPQSAAASATTLTPDATPPTVSITAPVPNTTVSGTITVSANASDNVGVADVQFQLDGTNLGPDLKTAPYSISWDTTTASNAPHTLTAIARDTSGNTTTSAAVGITISNTVVLPPTSGLLGYWNLDENAGSIAHDSSGNAYNGTVTGATWVAGKINSALSFNGSTNYVVTPNIPFTNTFSVSTWVNPSATTQGGYVRIAESQYNSGLYLGTNSSGTKYKFIVNNGTGTTGSCGAAFGCAEGGTITSGWHLVTGTFDGTTAKLYVDNAMVASDTATPPANTSLPFYIARYYAGTGYGWNGAIDEVRLYNRALSSTEVSTIYNYSGTSDTTPPTTPTGVTATAVSSTQINVSWTASTDNVGVAGYRVYRNGTQVGTTTAVTYSDTGLTASTTYSYTVSAFDAAGNVSPQSAPVSATTLAPDTTPPTVSITAPTGNTTVSGTITVSANASDNVGVADVQFQLDGTNLGPDLKTAPYSISWDTTTASNAPHTLTAIAKDTSGNKTTSAGVSVTVSNTVVPPPTQGLIGYWSFNEGSGTVAHDTSGSGYNGTVNGATWTTGKKSSGLLFNGTTDDVVTPNIPLGQTFSVSVWVNGSVAPQAVYARILETQYNGGLYLGTDQTGTKYKFIVNTGNGSTGSCGAGFGCAEGGSVTSGWHLVTATFDGTTAKLYVDNAVAGSDTFTAPANTSFPLYMGRYYAGTGYGWNGVLDEVRIYNRALTATEVATIYNY